MSEVLALGHHRVATEGWATSGAVTLWYDAVGPDDGPVVLLLSGATAQADAWWQPNVVDDLADRGFRVVRFDTRDIGRSTWTDDSYTLDDLAGDALAVLDAIGVRRAHLFGASLGGMVAQRVALRAPERVATLTLLATSRRIGDPALPVASAAHVAAVSAAPPTTAEQAVAYLTAIARSTEGHRWPSTEDELRRRAADALLRGQNPACRHYDAIFRADDVTPRLGGLDLPVLVVHGTDDPVLPVAHGRALAAAVPGAHLVEVDGLGHALPAAGWAEVRDDVTAHLLSVRPSAAR